MWVRENANKPVVVRPQDKNLLIRACHSTGLKQVDLIGAAIYAYAKQCGVSTNRYKIPVSHADACKKVGRELDKRRAYFTSITGRTVYYYSSDKAVFVKIHITRTNDLTGERR